MANSVAHGFIRMQMEMNRVQDLINAYLDKTFELGRVPAEDDMCCNRGQGGGGCPGN
jgi:hypothetical protein